MAICVGARGHARRGWEGATKTAGVGEEAGAGAGEDGRRAAGGGDGRVGIVEAKATEVDEVLGWLDLLVHLLEKGTQFVHER